MFYKVKVFNSQGQLKKVVSSKKLSNRFWRNNDNMSSYYDDSYAKSEELSTKGNIKTKNVSLDNSF